MNEPRVSFPGPFTAHDVVVDGWRVPHLHAHPCGITDEKIMLVIDGRLADTFTVEEAERFVPFLAELAARAFRDLEWALAIMFSAGALAGFIAGAIIAWWLS